MLQRRVGGVVGAEAGEALVLGEDDGLGVAAALDDAAQEGGNGDAALGVDRVQRAALEQMLKRHDHSPFAAQSGAVRGRAA